MSESGAIYCIDTSSFVELRRYYRETFKSLWSNLEALIRDGRLIAPTAVLDELAQQEDELYEWATRQKRKMFKAPTSEVVLLAREIVNDTRCRGLFDYAKLTPDADPFLVALAVSENKKRTLFRKTCIVVTEESSRPGSMAKIPAVCKAYGIRSIQLRELFAQ